MHRILPLFCLFLVACASGDSATQERLACLGEDASSRCATVWEKDLGLAVPAASGSSSSGVPLYSGASSRKYLRSAQSGTCRDSGMAYGGGSSITREIDGTARRVGMVNPRPGDGALQTERCTCLTRPGGASVWSCR